MVPPTRDIEPAPPEPGRGRSILLLVSGSIAAYKSCILLRQLIDQGFSVRVAMTDAATRFVAPLTFEALSGRKVGTSLWGEGGEEPLDHIQWAKQADLILVCPATANLISKMATGLADDLPSTLLAAAHSPVMVAPAMNDRMWANPATVANVESLRSRGVEIVQPGQGYLACGTEAAGRLAEPEIILEAVLSGFQPGPLNGKQMLITAGGTREPIDAVRFIGNRSSGRMGIELARSAALLGARTTLLLGPTELSPPENVQTFRFETSEDLAALVHEHAPAAHAIVMAAAVSDFRPEGPRTEKWKKSAGPPTLELTATEDILKTLSIRRESGQTLIGFALETGNDEDVQKQAQAKLLDKNLDLICGNHADRPGEGFEGSGNRIFMQDRHQPGQWVGPADKSELSRLIWERVIRLMGRTGRREGEA